MMQLSQVSAAVNGQLIGEDAILQGISINTREDCNGKLFVALKGDNFDAHDFLHKAVGAGAGGALVEQACDVDLPKILVADTHKALRDLAAWWRAQFVLPLIGITGSVGKTTVKEMLGSIFSQLGQGVVTQGNLNNEIGVPLTLMRLDEQCRYAVVEMGMNHRGEISRITDMAKPTIAIVNNAAAAHLEGLGTIEGVAQAKGEIFEGLTADGVAIINADDDFESMWRELARDHQVVSFGLNSRADVWAEYVQKDDVLKMLVHLAGKKKTVSLRAEGEHNVRNALAAIAAAHAAHIPFKLIKAGLAAYRPIAGRMVSQSFGSLTIIDDTYNANPASMRAAISVLANRCTRAKSSLGPSTLIVGDMRELGDVTEQEHIKLGEFAAQMNIDQLLVCGEFAHLVGRGFGPVAKVFEDQATLISFARQNVRAGTVLVKGSRSAKMERVVQALSDKFVKDENNNNAESANAGDH